jgi:peptide/nickel transport system substrate-binding protein
LIFDRIAELGPGLSVIGDTGFKPLLARTWSWSADSLSLRLNFAPASWHDGQPVKSTDYAFALRLLRNPALASSVATDLADIDSITTPDDRTAVVHFTRRDPEQFYVATLLVPLPEHVLGAIPPAELRAHAAVRAPVGSGQYRFVAWEPNVRIELGAVEGHYRGRPNLDRVIFAKSADVSSGLARLWAGESDLWEPVTPDVLPEAARYPHVRVVGGPGFDYGFVAFNFRDPAATERAHPILGDRAVRRALTMATDRDAVRRTVFDSLATVALGPFVRAQTTADTTVTQIPFDRTAAAAELDRLGWRVGAGGIRHRNGRPLRLSLLVPTSSVVRSRSAVVIQEQWKEIGVDVRIEGLEFQLFLERLASGRFDLAISSWRTTPSPRGIRSTWGSPAIAGASRQNAGRYENPAFDSAVVAGLGAMVLRERRAHLRRAYELINDDAAAIWLFEVRNAAAVHTRYEMPAWRSDAWWVTLGEWRVDPTQRLPRDAAPTTP